MRIIVWISVLLLGIILGVRCQSTGNLIEDFSNMIEYGLSDLVDRSEMIHRDKRAANASSPNDTQDRASDDHEAMACVVIQLQQFQDEMRSNASSLVNLTANAANISHQFYSSISPEALDTFCGIYVPHQKEISKCDNSTLKTYIADGFAIFDFICLERLDDFKKQLPCLQKVDAEISTKCSPNCTDEQDEKYSKLSPGNALTSALAQGNDTLEAFTHFCRHLKCLVRCQTPIVRAQCGEPAVKLIHDGVRITFQKLNHLTIATGSEAYWPRECNRLASDDLSKKKDEDLKTKPVETHMEKMTTYN